MNKPTTVTTVTSLRWRVSVLLLLSLSIQTIPRAVGQRDADKRSWNAKPALLEQHQMLQPQSALPAPLQSAGCSSWVPTGSLKAARDSHTATLLPDGIVLAAGGFGVGGVFASAELYDPATGTWMTADSLSTARSQHTATLLPNGMVLVAGGFDNTINVSAKHGTVRPGKRDLG